ncbi:LPS export ABC transporter periplasmic protein LptC [bacterium BMS3Abin03]|jgi:LPS export ABC transporter protein LptC|nr:LPS export ABC transporter periplasmic protein LptC [bacterium BMS3Abin03]MCG6959445.1 LPS export ABC transporter periplasmic protein LptC [bacterium BMS3Abin03]
MKRFLFIVTGLIILVIGCSKEKVKPSINTNISSEELPDQESWNSTVFFTDSGKTQAILWAGHLRVFGNTNTTLLDSNIKVDFYNNKEVKTTTLTAKRGKVDENTNNLYALDSVVAINDSGVVIKTDEMMWRNKDRKIVSDKYVTIVSPKEKIEGYGFESDQNLRNYVIYDITYITNADSVK